MPSRRKAIEMTTEREKMRCQWRELVESILHCKTALDFSSICLALGSPIMSVVDLIKKSIQARIFNKIHYH